jgi:hypothetical protein
MLARRLGLVATLVLAPLLAAGCGGKDYSGKVDVPKGYSVVRQAGVSFVRPAGFSDQELRTPRGLRQTHFGDPAAAGKGSFVVFSTQAGVGKRFDSLVDDTRRVVESTDGKVELDAVDVPGAQKAYRSTIDAPDQPGTGDVHSQVLQVLLRDGTYVSLTAGTTERDKHVDVDAVLDSFRVQGA